MVATVHGGVKRTSTPTRANSGTRFTDLLSDSSVVMVAVGCQWSDPSVASTLNRSRILASG